MLVSTPHMLEAFPNFFMLASHTHCVQCEFYISLWLGYACGNSGATWTLKRHIVKRNSKSISVFTGIESEEERSISNQTNKILSKNIQE